MDLWEGQVQMEPEWLAALPRLRQQVGDRNFATWIEPIRCCRDDDGLRLEVASRFFQEWVTRHFLTCIRDALAESSSKLLAGMRDRVEETVEQAADAARESYDAVKQGYAEAERAVQERPGQAVALAFGLGLLSGLGAALLMRNRATESRLAEGRSMSERFARQMCDAFASIAPDAFARRS